MTNDPDQSEAGIDDAPRLAPHAGRVVWPVLALGVGLLVVASAFDQPFSNWMTQPNVRATCEFWVNTLFAVSFYIYVMAVLGAFPNWRRLWVGFLTPVLLSTLLLHGLKIAIGRSRPLANLGPWHFEPFSMKQYCDSFPSGHAMAAATAAALLGVYFPRWRGVFYLFALLVGLERVYTDWHYASDVITGFVLGALVVIGCVRGIGASFYCKERQIAQRSE